MTFPSSGAISLSQINIEKGIASNTTVSMNDAASRSLAGNGNTLASGASWSMSVLYGRQFYKYSLSPITYWYNDGSGALLLYYGGANTYAAYPANAASLTSVTSGGYTYFRGGLQSTQFVSTGGESGGGYNAYYYSIARQ